MLMSVLIVGFPLMGSSQESRVFESGNEEGPMSGPNGSSYTASIVLGSDNPEHDGHAMGYTYGSSTSYYNCYSTYYSYMYKCPV
jgi:hypothetical protein